MLTVLFTLDYEIHGNGDGCPYQLMVEPTARMLRLFEEYGAKLTIMADVAEILKFKEYKESHGRDDYHYEEIVGQLQDAVRRGHDVQLHLHASYFNARHEGGRWQQDWSEYNFAGLSLERLNEVVKLGREFLESLLRPMDADYRCTVFRAANWAVSPSHNVVKALIHNGIQIDTSVFKYGRREGIVNFDYTSAWSNLFPWKAAADDLCRKDDHGALTEVPIYCELRWVGAFLTPNRIYRVLLSRAHRVEEGPADRVGRARADGRSGMLGRFGLVTRKHPWKADFNQCSGRQLIKAVERAAARVSSRQGDVPFVLIGHSKLFTKHNERTLRPFLAHVAKDGSRLGFGTFGAVAAPLGATDGGQRETAERAEKLNPTP